MRHLALVPDLWKKPVLGDVNWYKYSSLGYCCRVAYHIDTDGKLCSSQDKDGEASDGSCLGTDKEIITAQSLTIVEEDGSLGSGEDQAAVAELAHTQGLLDAGDEDVQYQFRSGEGG
jgi:hypothetical protein